MLHCLTDQTLLGQRRLAPNLSGYGLGSFVNFAFLSPNEQPHTRRSGEVKHRLTRARCKGILTKEVTARQVDCGRSADFSFSPQQAPTFDCRWKDGCRSPRPEVAADSSNAR